MLARRSVAAGLGLLLASCRYGPDPDRRNDFVVLFGTDATLDQQAQAIIRAAAGAARRAPDLDVTVAGYGDAATAPEANQILSRIRAQSVANALVASGVDQARIHLSPRHAVGADPGTESRRVEIRVGT